MDSIDLGELDKIEKDIIIKNADWYYHGFDFALMSDILEEGILSELSNVLRAIEKISDYDNEYNKCREIIQNAYYDLEEVEKDLYNYKENAYFDEEERRNIEQRIDLIQDLKRKYGNNIEEILEYQKDVKEQIETIENLSDYIEQIKNEKTDRKPIRRGVARHHRQPAAPRGNRKTDDGGSRRHPGLRTSGHLQRSPPCGAGRNPPLRSTRTNRRAILLLLRKGA